MLFVRSGQRQASGLQTLRYRLLCIHEIDPTLRNLMSFDHLLTEVGNSGKELDINQRENKESEEEGRDGLPHK